jgi:hypothetical protein
MEIIDRAAVIVTPKKPFYDWANSLEPQESITEDELDEKETVYLLPERDSNEQIAKLLQRSFWREIFEQELFAWHTDESGWPENLSYATFREWFDVKICSMVFDVAKGAILKEPALGEE